MSKVIINEKAYDMDLVVMLMDDEIREELHEEGFESDQGFCDAYCVKHAQKFDGEEFAIN